MVIKNKTKRMTASLFFFIILGGAIGAGIYESTSAIPNVFAQFHISKYIFIAWDNSNSACNSRVQYAVIYYLGNETDLARGSCRGLLLSVDVANITSALTFVESHSTQLDAVIFDDYSSYYFGPYYANFSAILPVIPVMYYPSYDYYALKYSSSVIVAIGYADYPDLPQSASTAVWNQTVISYVNQTRSIQEISTGKTYGFSNVFVLLYEHPTSFQKHWSASYINGTLEAAEKFTGVIVWNGDQY